jgi:hypothetical protein
VTPPPSSFSRARNPDPVFATQTHSNHRRRSHIDSHVVALRGRSLMPAVTAAKLSLPVAELSLPVAEPELPVGGLNPHSCRRRHHCLLEAGFPFASPLPLQLPWGLKPLQPHYPRRSLALSFSLPSPRTAAAARHCLSLCCRCSPVPLPPPRCFHHR